MVRDRSFTSPGRPAAHAGDARTITLISTSTHIWPGVLASKEGDGVMAALCRARSAEVAVRAAGCVGSRLVLKVLERSSYKVIMIMESPNVRQIAAALEGGPQLVDWTTFQQRGPRGDVGRLLPAVTE
ncbi:MAG: hypothetical protein SGPRY_008827 [Prymnesium sp.]